MLVLYWKEKHAGQYSIDKFPTFFHQNAIGSFSVFGSGCHEYPGLVKVTSYHDIIDNILAKHSRNSMM